MSAAPAIITVHRDAASLDGLLQAAPAVNLFTLKPVRKGKPDEGTGGRRLVYPQPAVPADVLAAQLQDWLQDEETAVADPERLGVLGHNLWEPLPAIKITEADVVNLAANGTPFADPASEMAYKKWCVRRFGVAVCRPDTVYGWEIEEETWWGPEALAEHIWTEVGCVVEPCDLQRAAAGLECTAHAATQFFSEQAVQGCILAAAKNLPDEPKPTGPYYAWNNGFPVPADEMADIVAQAQEAGTISPAVQYAEDQPGPGVYRSLLATPTTPDPRLIERIARGEFTGRLPWAGSIKRVDMYAWNDKPNPPQTAGDMAEDIEAILGAPVTAKDVEAIAAHTCSIPGAHGLAVYRC